MSLQDKLDTFKKDFESGAPPYNASPDVIATMHRATEELRSSGISERALKVGDAAPDFLLPDHTGEIFDSKAARAKGPLVVTFYRGVW